MRLTSRLKVYLKPFEFTQCCFDSISYAVIFLEDNYKKDIKPKN